MNRGRFKTEINHSVTQPVIHPSFLFFKVYLTYKLLFGLDQISFYIRSTSNCENKIRFSAFFLLPKSLSRYCRPSCTKVGVNSIQFIFWNLTYKEYYVHKVKMILQYCFASSQQNELWTCTFFIFFSFFRDHGSVIKVVSTCSLLVTTISSIFVIFVPVLVCKSSENFDYLWELPLGKKEKKKT